MRRHRTQIFIGILATTGVLIVSACGGAGFDDPESGDDTGATSTAAGEDGDAGDLTSSDDPLTVLIGSSGEAETTAVETAVANWSDSSGVDATVSVANDLTQQLSQGFAAGSPPDLFYLAPEALAGYATNGSLQAYGDSLSNKDDFYPSLVENFTFEDQFYCAPKDFSTLALVINEDLWADAGLGDADIPTDWEELSTVSEKLTTDGRVGLAFGAEYQRVGAFMAEAGGDLVEDGEAVADSAGNVEALDYVKTHLSDGTFAFAADIGAGWAGEALGKELSAMVIEGNWITGAMMNDFPDVNYTVAELPAGPAGKGTMQFTNCWGMATDSPNQKAAADLVEYLTGSDQQLAFSDAFGPMPSITSAADGWKDANPNLVAFLNGAEYAKFPPNEAGAVEVIADFNSQLESLKSTDAKTILDSVQGNLTAVVG